MAKETVKNARKEKFTMVSNKVLNFEKKMTLQAKGLLSILISNNTDRFDINMKEIFSRSKNGRDAHYGVIDELIKFGYFARVEIRENGKFEEIIYIFSDDKQDVLDELEQYQDNPNALINPNKKKPKKKDKPVDNTPFPGNQDAEKTPYPENQETAKKSKTPVPENQDTGNPETGNPNPEDQYINNINQNNTNENNTNLNNTNINQSNHIDDILNEITDVPMNIKKVISINKDGMISKNIHPFEIETFYNSSDNILNDMDFAQVLMNVLRSKTKINTTFVAYFKGSIQKWFNEYHLASSVSSEPKVTDEELPW